MWIQQFFKKCKSASNRCMSGMGEGKDNCVIMKHIYSAWDLFQHNLNWGICLHFIIYWFQARLNKFLSSHELQDWGLKKPGNTEIRCKHEPKRKHIGIMFILGLINHGFVMSICNNKTLYRRLQCQDLLFDGNFCGCLTKLHNNRLEQ